MGRAVRGMDFPRPSFLLLSHTRPDLVDIPRSSQKRRVTNSSRAETRKKRRTKDAQEAAPAGSASTRSRTDGSGDNAPASIALSTAVTAPQQAPTTGATTGDGGHTGAALLPLGSSVEEPGASRDTPPVGLLTTGTGAPEADVEGVPVPRADEESLDGPSVPGDMRPARVALRSPPSSGGLAPAGASVALSSSGVTHPPEGFSPEGPTAPKEVPPHRASLHDSFEASDDAEGRSNEETLMDSDPVGGQGSPEETSNCP